MCIHTIIDYHTYTSTKENIVKHQSCIYIYIYTYARTNLFIFQIYHRKYDWNTISRVSVCVCIQLCKQTFSYMYICMYTISSFFFLFLEICTLTWTKRNIVKHNYKEPKGLLIDIGMSSISFVSRRRSFDLDYRVAKTHRIPYLYRSFSAKVTYI